MVHDVAQKGRIFQYAPRCGIEERWQWLCGPSVRTQGALLRIMSRMNRRAEEKDEDYARFSRRKATRQISA